MSKQQFTTHLLGFPRIGANRELKWALEKFWKKQLSQHELEQVASELRTRHWAEQAASGLDYVTTNDFSFYDQVLDTACTFGIIPERFGWDGKEVSLALYFSLARGSDQQPALAMTKWFDTNYHYLVPEVEDSVRFRLHPEKSLNEYRQASEQGYQAKPCLVGPVTLLSLSRRATAADADPLDRLDDLLPLYADLLNQLSDEGAEWIQLEEPITGQDLSATQQEQIHYAYTYLVKSCPKAKILLTSYFGDLAENLDLLTALPVAGLHFDLSEGRDSVEAPLRKKLSEYPQDKVISLGLLDGRNIWKTNLKKKKEIILEACQHLEAKNIWLSCSCSLLHLPYSLEQETLAEPLRSYLAFASEKLHELRLLATFEVDSEANVEILKSAQHHYTRIISKEANVEKVRKQCELLNKEENRTRRPYASRAVIQQEALNLPLLPTTTIGSFPQTAEIRKIRKLYKKGELSQQQYKSQLMQHTADCIKQQEEVGLDVLVHGEFERNDMVEFFADKLNGYAFTSFGWVQSYGSRCVKPPIIWADVSRNSSLSEDWIYEAQKLTDKPVKGMLSGPITMLQWSFVRDDIARESVALQIAVALREEILELEANGVTIIQVDEPALREGLPLRSDQQAAYLAWAVNAFKLATAGVKDGTQIHTHMCYGNFEDIFQAIIDLDADVISIEATRNKLSILNSFVQQHYPNEIGLGIWDIHSPRVPSAEEMEQLLAKAITLIEPSRVWANPDCGLKTRAWAEVKPSLRHLVAAAKSQRKLLTERASAVLLEKVS